MIHNFFTDEIIKLDNPKEGDFDEFVDLFEVTLKEAKKMIEEEKIVDFKSIYGVQIYERFLMGDFYDKKEQRC